MSTNNFSYFTEQGEIVKASFVSIHNHQKFNFTISTPSFWADTLVSITVLLSSPGVGLPITTALLAC